MSGLCRASARSGLPQEETAMSSHIKEAKLPVRCVYFPASTATATRNCQQAKAIWTQAKAGCKCGWSWGLQRGRANYRTARKSQFRSKKSRRARAEEARMDGMDTTIQNADDMDVDGDNFPLDIDHDGTLVLSAPACCMRNY